MPNRRYTNPAVIAYLQTLKTFVATTRFNEQTWGENQRFMREATQDGTLPAKIRCLYPCSVAIGETVPIGANVLVLEMNNETNQLMGIGLIKNHEPMYQRFQVYSQDKYNTYAYQGAYRIGREDMNEEEMTWLRMMERYCFKGARHQKRMMGIKLFPRDILYDIYTEHDLDMTSNLASMFKQRFM